MSETIKLIIYEDNRELRESFVALLKLSDGIELIAAFENCMNVEKETALYDPHVVLMDIDLPGINGIEAVKKIKKINPNVQVIMLTVFDDNSRIFDSICAGACGYLLKRTPPHKIIEAIFDAKNGGAPMTSSVARQVLEVFSKLSAEKSRQENYNLTQRENETLTWLVQGFSYKMIAGKMDITIDTVRAHIKKIYEKLHVHSLGEAVAKAINQKLV
ncbi:MAG: response regulator transcription factor [Bacteroidia bacterium]|nr:response regulator transcription factor [Bacteroidia bacterium]